jgi:hypothetical protein
MGMRGAHAIRSNADTRRKELWLSVPDSHKRDVYMSIQIIVINTLRKGIPIAAAARR